MKNFAEKVLSFLFFLIGLLLPIKAELQANTESRPTLSQFYSKLDSELRPSTLSAKTWDNVTSLVKIMDFLISEKEISFHSKDLQNGRFKELRKTYLNLQDWEGPLKNSMDTLVNLPARHFEPEASYLKWIDPKTPDWLAQTYTCNDMNYLRESFPLFSLKILGSMLATTSALKYGKNFLKLRRYFADFEKYYQNKQSKKKNHKKRKNLKIK